ncbi:hypothetical protein HMPREF9602_01521 [Cutibacterium acnes HL030PA2]|nr:hypothetical protein HMPREF9602_01521 [Cutibacterium acnes HL030PA2]
MPASTATIDPGHDFASSHGSASRRGGTTTSPGETYTRALRSQRLSRTL